MEKEKLNYAASGVDIAAADKAKEKIKTLAKATFNESVLSEIGAFGGFFRPELTGMKSPVLISSADGVGTKLKLAFMSRRHNTVGEDLVNHCVNDILVHGARPLFFLDYIATGKLDPETVAEIVEGLARGCRNNGMALLGGETAEMPDFYSPGEYDLAGFIVGLADKEKIINGANIAEGDVIIGLASNGLHTNGYSLARKVIFDVGGMKYNDNVESMGMTIGDALLMTHKSYLKSISPLIDDFEIKGMAHITGGGISGNFVRILPDNVKAVIRKGTWNVKPIFDFIQKTGSIADEDMFEAFNMGIGYIVVISENNVDNVVESLKASGELPYIIGKIEKGEKEIVIKD
ncbi:MAG TPA: phosphoribosylformylglycinamidine cyclo-ligase [candidate division Zixibacteria bacterium]|nr:phosphoribosylformylglycinamidine cyclo-ligase [candidate division Zixibacteria bacterium]